MKTETLAVVGVLGFIVAILVYIIQSEPEFIIVEPEPGIHCILVTDMHRVAVDCWGELDD